MSLWHGCSSREYFFIVLLLVGLRITVMRDSKFLLLDCTLQSTPLPTVTLVIGSCMPYLLKRLCRTALRLVKLWGHSQVSLRSCQTTNFNMPTLQAERSTHSATSSVSATHPSCFGSTAARLLILTRSNRCNTICRFAICPRGHSHVTHNPAL